ncbi:VOC family protein [Myxococcota bacterium]|nr:VOC family protein [Myxococcota bacterium]
MALEIQKFSHVVMQVSDLARSVEFYHGLLGLPKLFERSFTDPRSGRTQQVVGCLVGEAVVLEMGADPARPRTVDGSSSPILALSVADIHEAHRRLLEAGVTPVMPPTEMAPGLFMIFLRDPDGRTIELAQFSGGATCSVDYARMQG